jgi:dTDP-4-dehydrorhamnose 3,5-epimerase
MGAMKLDDILVTPLRQIETPGGDVLHAMKQGDSGYAGFGEAYFSWVSKGAIKAWKRHSLMTMNLVVPVGRVRFVFFLFDGADKFRVEEIGVGRYTRITVPPGIWFGFCGIHAQDSLVLNIANLPHNENEVERLPLKDINYEWSNL